MQTAALLKKPMQLGFDPFSFLFQDNVNISSDTVFVDDIYIPGNDVNYDFSYDSQDPSAGDSFSFTTGDYDFAVVDTSGDVNTQSGQPLITANTLSQIAINNPGREAVAVAQSLQVTNPEWTKQFKNTDDLVRAAAGLFSTVKAVVTGQPIPRNTQNPYVYGPGQSPTYRPSTGLTTTHMLLIGGAALAAILLLRRK